ncbi:MAG: MBL fold metallo-hydrolase [Bacteroidota bacterium]
MMLTVLGCGDAFGNGGRNNTAFLVTEKDEHILLDCGTTTLIQLKKEQIDLEQVSVIILSHFHGDHFGGVPFFLISSMFETKRKSKLTIVGPKGVKEKVYALQEAMYPGTTQRLSDLTLEFVAFEPERSIEIDDKRIIAYPVNHSEPSIPHGVRLTWCEKTIAFSGDTSWTDYLLPLSKGADLFICECNFLDQQAYGHLSYHELMNKKDQLSCDAIWLTHMNDRVIEAPDIRFNRLEDGMKLTI